MDPADLRHRFTFHPATIETGSEHEAVREACHLAAQTINDLAPDSREKSLAITALEEAMMWGNAAIARNT